MTTILAKENKIYIISFAEKYNIMSYCFYYLTHNIIMKKYIKNKRFFKYIILLFTFFSFFYNFSNYNLFAQDYYYTSNVEHLFTHCLIAYPEIAFKHNNQMREHYAIDCITNKEFINILDELYKRNYILVSLNSCFNVENGIAIKTKIKIPVGKKPLVLSFDDVNYDHKKMGMGMVDKIIVDENGNLASLTKIGNYEDIRYDVEFIPILEQFVKNHPDFSLNNAKGVLNLTGYDGILGYRTSHTNQTNREEEILNAKKVVNKLKENGWEFASHSYGHYHMNKISLEKWENEVNLWKEEVESIVGKTKIYVYPYGEWQVFDNGEICEKHRLLQDAGFYLFCGVGMNTYYSYLPNKLHRVLFMDRKCVDGSTLNANRKELFPFFNPKLVIDSIRKF